MPKQQVSFDTQKSLQGKDGGGWTWDGIMEIYIGDRHGAVCVPAGPRAEESTPLSTDSNV